MAEIGKDVGGPRIRSVKEAMMVEKSGGKGIDEAVLEALQFGGLDKTNLQELVKIISRFNNSGIRPIKVFPKGIPAPDGVWIHTELDFEKGRDLIDLIREIPRVDEIRVFPKGIPFPDVLFAEIGLR